MVWLMFRRVMEGPPVQGTNSGDEERGPGSGYGTTNGWRGPG